jgi:hypothetical protein
METNDIWQEGNPILVCGKVSDKDGEAKVLVEKVMILDAIHPEITIDNFKKAMLDNPIKKRYEGNVYVKKEKTVQIISGGKLVLSWKQKPQNGDLINFKNFLIDYGGNDYLYFIVDGKEIKSNIRVKNTEIFRNNVIHDWGNYLEIV